MPRKKTADPQLVKLLDRLAAAQDEFEKWYARLKRAFNRAEKARGKITRLRRSVARREEELRQPAPAPATDGE